MAYHHTFYREDENGEETAVMVEFSVSKYYKATWDDPAEGGEVEIITALVLSDDGKTMLDAQMTDAECERWTQYLEENPDEYDDGVDWDSIREAREEMRAEYRREG